MKKYNTFEKVSVFFIFIWILFYLIIKFGEFTGFFFECIKSFIN